MVFTFIGFMILGEVTMNYFIFGGSGFIGTHLIKLIKQECLKENDRIYDLDIVMPGE